MRSWIILFFSIGLQILARKGGYCQDTQIVTYWGQSSAWGQNSREEKDLVELCREDSPFDIINVGFVEKYFDELNSDRTPGLNFAGHCKTPIDGNHRALFSCPVIERGIRTCQQNGKKVLIAIGGPRGKGSFDGEAQAEKFAETIWNLFMGGHDSPDLRPFSSAVCDGVNIMAPGGSFVGYPAFIRHLFYLTKRDRTRKYIITASPSCNFPDSVLGPGPNKALETSVKYIDHLYVRFYGSNCGVAENSLFEESLDAWLDFVKRMMQRDGESPLVFIGVPAMERASPVTGCYQSTRDLREIYKRFRENKFFGGFMIWDASWDQTNIQYGKSFAERLLIATKDFEEQEAENFDEDEDEEQPIEPAPQQVTTPITLATTNSVTYPTEPPQTPPPPTLPQSTVTAPPPPPPSPTPPPESPDENPYENNDEMEEGEGEPVDQEQPEDEEEQLPQGEGEQPQGEEQLPQGEGEQPQGEEEQPEGEGEQQEEDPNQPRPPDMENRYPQNQVQPVNDEKAYQEEDIPFSLEAELLAAKAEKERKRQQWLKQKKKEQWLLQQSKHAYPFIFPVNKQQYPMNNVNSPPQYKQPSYPGLAHVSRHPVMPYGFFSKQLRKNSFMNRNSKTGRVTHENRYISTGRTNIKSEVSGSGLPQIESSGSGTGSGSGSGHKPLLEISVASKQKSSVESGSGVIYSTSSGSGNNPASGSGSGMIT